LEYKDIHINLIEGIQTFITAHQLIEKQEIILLAVSGGVDSLVMVTLFKAMGIPFAIAHANFGLRGEVAKADADFVEKVANQHHVTFHLTTFNTIAYAKENHLSIQMAARELRYNWLGNVCHTHGYQKIATAHHANDALETLLFNLTKGTGISGLHGIIPKQGNLIRPLLFATKKQLIAFAETMQLHWREDSSNQHIKYARNLIRHQVIPPLMKINPNLIETSQVTLEKLVQVENIFQNHVKQIKKQICVQKNNMTYIHYKAIKDTPWATVVLWELLKSHGFGFAQIKHFLYHVTQSGKKLQNKYFQLQVDRDHWLLSIRQQIDAAHEPICISWDQKECNLPIGNLLIRKMPYMDYKISSSTNIAALDAAKIAFPLQIRPWQSGDCFVPLGMKNKKKVSDFLIDLKIPLMMKKKVNVLLIDGKIAWLIGYRIDERFKLSKTTQEVYEIALKDFSTDSFQHST